MAANPTLSPNRTQVLVLGGGPAGGAVALELAQAGWDDVVLLERQARPGWKIGETLPPEARVHLQRLNHWQTFQQSGHRPCYGIVSCWGSAEPVERDFLSNPYGHGWQLDRATFEATLLQAARDAGCRIFSGAEVHTLRYQGDAWYLETSLGEFQGEWVLDCTGRKGILAAQGWAGAFVPLPDTVSLYCLLQSTTGTDRDGRTYVESHPSGWAYSALMPSGLRIVAFLTDRDQLPANLPLAEWLQQRIQEGPQIQQLLQAHDYAPVKTVHPVNATSGRYQQVAGCRWLLVGDAGMTFDPLSGWGSAKAMVSAAAAIATILEGSDYPAACEELWQVYLRQYRDYYLAEQRWPNAPFWSRRQQ
ncbi:MAG: FAD-dependent oxidoreductase [Cyanobacteria bacterium P01_G01_bin.54]